MTDRELLELAAKAVGHIVPLTHTQQPAEQSSVLLKKSVKK